MNLSGDLVWKSFYYTQIPFGLTDSVINRLVDYTRKRIYISDTINNSGDERILIQLFDFDMNKLGEWLSPVGVYISLSRLRFTLNIDGSRILMASATSSPFAPIPGYLNIDFNNFSNSVLTSATFDLGLRYGNGGEGAFILGANKNKMYVARDGGGVFFAQRNILFQTVDYPSLSSYQYTLYNTGINAALLSTYNFNHQKNELETLVVLSDLTTVEFWTFNFDTLTLTRSNNNLQNYADDRTGAVLLLSVEYDVLKITWWDINDPTIKVGYFDKNMNLLSIEGNLFINAQRAGTAAGRLNVVTPLDEYGNELGFYYYQQDYWRTLPEQSTLNKSTISGTLENNGGNMEQNSLDKPLKNIYSPHIVEIDTSLSGVTSNTQFQTTGMVGEYNVYYDDKQGTTGWINNLKDEEILNFPQSGIYELSIFSVKKILGFQFNNSGDKDKLLKIKQWGGSDYSRGNSFLGCSNLTEVITNEYILIGGINTFRQCTSLTTFDVNIIVFTTYMSNTFYGCINLTSVNFKGFKTHLITRMEDVFRDCPLTHIDASYWNVENLELMRNGGLAGRDNTNVETINVKGWKPKKLQNMSVGFSGLTNIKEIIGIDEWETPNLTQLLGAFAFCGFNNPNYIPLNLSNWDMSDVFNMFQTFRGTKLSGDISKWDVSKVTDMNWNSSSLLYFESINSEVYTKCLIAWSQLNLESNVEFIVGATQYDASAQSAKDYIINTFGWTITDGGQI